MKRRQFLLTAILIGAMAVAAGCSSKNTGESTPPVETEASGDEGTEENADSDAEQSTLTGVIEEIKDFMFTVVDEDDNAYALSFGDEKPEGLADVKAGDKVVVTYTGELSMVDAFTGEIISVEKVD